MVFEQELMDSILHTATANTDQDMAIVSNPGTNS